MRIMLGIPSVQVIELFGLIYLYTLKLFQVYMMYLSDLVSSKNFYIHESYTQACGLFGMV